MAYLPSPIDQEQDDPSLVKSGSGGIISGSSTAARPSRDPGQKNSGFTNVSEYIEANKPQIEQFSGQVASGLQSKLDKAQQSSGILDTLVGSKPTTQDYSDVLGVAKTGNLKDLTEEQKGKIKSFTLGQYGGPEDYRGSDQYLQAMRDKEEALQLLKLAGSDQGTGTLIQKTVAPNRSQYSAGESAFDAALLRSDKGAREKLEKFAAKEKPLVEQYKQQEAKNLGTIQKGQEQFRKGKEDLSTVLRERFQGLKNLDTPERVQALRQSMWEQNQKPKIDRLNQIRAEELQKFGKQEADVARVSPENFMNVPGVDYYNYIQSTLSPQERQDYSILADLLGEDTSILSEGTPAREPSYIDEEGYRQALRDLLTPKETFTVNLPGYDETMTNYGAITQLAPRTDKKPFIGTGGRPFIKGIRGLM